jgi:nicotinamide-nucleotide amidase
MHSDLELKTLAAQVADRLRPRGHTLVTAESCTGGWVGKVLTELPGSSAWYLGGVVSYSNALKAALLDVQNETLATYGAVSAETAGEMAVGALKRLGATYSLAVTGIAGPDGGTPDKPVGLVWFGWASNAGDEVRVQVTSEQFTGDRDAVRRAAVARALRGVLELAERDG